MIRERVLICRGGALGDLLLTFPVLASIRAAWPGAHIILAAYPPQARLASVGGLVDEVISLDRADVAEWFATGDGLTAGQARFFASLDLTLSFLHDPGGRFSELMRQAGVRQVVSRSPFVTRGHAIDHFTAILNQVGLSVPPGVGAALKLPGAVLKCGSERIQALGGRLVAIHPGSGSARKNWPLERFVETAQMLANEGTVRPVFLLGEAERDLGAQLAARCPKCPRVTSLDVVELAGFLSGCAGYLGNDSGVTHLAAAVGIPVLALFGPTDPAVWAPRGPRVCVERSATATPGTLVRALGSICRCGL